MLCFHNDCEHYKLYRIGQCPMFKSRCQYEPKPPRRTRHNNRKLVQYHGYTKWGLTLGQRDMLRKYQYSRCAICNKCPTRLVLDHDHKTGLARGYLCNSCNHKLIGLEDKDFRERGINYLDNPPVKKANLTMQPPDRFTCPKRSCVHYDAYRKAACPYFDSELGCLHNR